MNITWQVALRLDTFWARSVLAAKAHGDGGATSFLQVHSKYQVLPLPWDSRSSFFYTIDTPHELQENE